MAEAVTNVAKQLKALPTGQDRASKRRRQQLWRQIDENGNGILSLAEIDHAIKKRWCIDIPATVINRSFHAARDLCEPLAQFSDDYIDFQEFRVFFVYLQHYYDLFKLFVQIDTSKDGRIGMDEFVKAVPLLKSWGVVGLEDPLASFRKMDVDGGGMVLFDEFAHWALHQGVSDFASDASDRESAMELLRNAEANLASKDFDDMKHSRFSVVEGIDGQGALRPSKTQGEVGRQIMAAAVNMSTNAGVLVVNVHQANGLRVADTTTSDPYVVLRYGDSEQHTKAIKRTLNPIWNETLRFSNHGKDLELEVFDYDVLSADDFLGRVCIDEKTLLSSKSARQRLKLTGAQAQGTIEVSFQWRQRK